MNRRTSKIVTLLITIICFIGWPIGTADAAEHELESMHIQVQLHENGDATVVEHRRAFLTDGTENFIPIEDLGKSKIENFTVKEDGIIYDFVESWDMSATREEKTYKNSMIETAAGYELVWGIGSYGAHEYVIQYTVTNMIKQLQDDQMLFWRFINDEMNPAPQNVTIEIETYRPITEENEKIWAFGFEGEIHFEKGKVVARSHKPFKSSNYGTVLIQFPNESFIARDFVDQTFAQVKEEAFAGSDYENTWVDFVAGALLTIVILLLIFVFPIIVIIWLVKGIRRIIHKIRRARIFRLIKKHYPDQYNRELPYEYDIIELFYLFEKMKLATNNTLIISFFLRWIHEGSISPGKETTGFIRKKEQVYLRFYKDNRTRTKLEGRLFAIMYRVSSIHKKISPKYSRWSWEDQKKMKKWQDDVVKHSRNRLFGRGFLKEADNEYVLTDQGKELVADIYKFINYLHNYSLLHEHEAINVTLWDELMIWASVLDITDVVAKQFEQLYPEYQSESAYSDIGTVQSLNVISHHVNQMAKDSTSNYGGGSGGGGGFTSVGGGGGSFGGGSGGGTR